MSPFPDLPVSRPGCPRFPTSMLGAGLALPVAWVYGYLTLLVPAVFVLVATMLSFMPEWSPSDFPPRAADRDEAESVAESVAR